MNICMVAIGLDKTGIISQANIIGIKIWRFPLLQTDRLNGIIGQELIIYFQCCVLTNLQDMACIVHEKNTDNSWTIITCSKIVCLV